MSIILIVLLAILVTAGLAVGLVVLVVWLVRRGKTAPPPKLAPAQSPPASATCPRCGTALPTDSPQGLCPRCVLGVGLATHTEATDGVGPHGTKVIKPPPAPDEIGKHFPQLEILECLGRGGMGVVYKARQPKLNRIVALKILAPEKEAEPKFAERFLREAQTLARLSHPNIVTVHDFGETDGLCYLLMEFVDGLTLRQMMREGRMKPEEALVIVPRICEALQFAHEQGVVHRDIKPENVLLDKQGRVKIADFGIAKIVGEAGRAGSPLPAEATQSDGGAHGVTRPTVALTQDHVLGTPQYMAPEQVEHPQTVDHRADIYSLGVVFYEMLTGELPLGKFQPPSKKVQVDVRLDEIVLRALQKEPELRYQQANVLKTEVETVAANPQTKHATSANLPWMYRGVDYRSKATLFGLPLLHVASGVDPATGKARVAKGIIAIGGIAKGVVAIGGVAMGGLTFGGLSIGVFAYGGCALGLMAFGGLAIALVMAFGGCAIAPIALGGGAIGYFAHGGEAIGVHVLDSMTKDPMAERFFLPWAKALFGHITLINTFIVVVIVGIGVGVPFWLQRRTTNSRSDRSQREDAQTEAKDKGADWRTWSPFQSPEVREICAHMSKAERRKTSERSGLYGLWCGATVGAAPALALLLSGPARWIVPAIFMLIHIALIPSWLKVQRRFVCSTAWAKAHGYSPERLRLFSFQVADAPQILLLVVLLTALAILLVSLLRPASTQPLQPQKRSQQIVGRQSKATFGPVIERVVRCDSSDSIFGIDLDSGRVEFFTFDKSLSDSEATNRISGAKYFADKGVDAMGFGNVGSPQLSGLTCVNGTFAIQATASDWDNQTAAAVLAHATNLPTAQEPVKNTPEFLKLTVMLWSEGGVLPQTYVFRTGAGGVGLLQITGFTDNPRGVKIRSKLVQNGNEPKQATMTVVQDWLALMDGGAFSKSWETAADSFHKATTKNAWVSLSERVRQPLGKVISRKDTSSQKSPVLPGFPDGSYYIVQFATSFATLTNAVETVTFGREKDGQWKAIGYLIHPRTDQETAAVTAAHKWLDRIDAGQYGESWTDAAEDFRAALTQDKWVSALNEVRTPLGKLKIRTVASAVATTNLPNAPAGEYVVMQFQTAFSNLNPATETVTFSLEKDGQWKASGYYIK